jgi:hypothetical protein
MVLGFVIGRFGPYISGGKLGGVLGSRLGGEPGGVCGVKEPGGGGTTWYILANTPRGGDVFLEQFKYEN